MGSIRTCIDQINIEQPEIERIWKILSMRFPG